MLPPIQDKNTPATLYIDLRHLKEVANPTELGKLGTSRNPAFLRALAQDYCQRMGFTLWSFLGHGKQGVYWQVTESLRYQHAEEGDDDDLNS